MYKNCPKQFTLVFFLILIFSGFIQAQPANADINDRQLVAKDDFDYPPYSFLDDNGSPTGFNIELLKKIAVEMDLDIRIELDPWSIVRNELETGQIDIIAGMYYSPERDKKVDFTQPHSITYGAIFSRRGSDIRSLEQLNDKTIIVLEADIMHDFLLESDIAADILLVESLTEGFRKLAAGNADCMLAENQQGRYVIRKNKLGNIITVGPPLSPNLYCFAVTEGDTQLLDALNEGLNRLKASGEYDRLFAKWRQSMHHKNQVRKILAYAALVMSVLSALVAVIFFWSWTLRKRVAEKTQQLQTELAERKRITKLLNLKNEELENIIYVNSHDLRSPIVNITGFSTELHFLFDRLEKILKENSLPDDVQAEISHIIDDEVPQCVKFITSNAKKIDDLQSGLLKISRLGTQTLNITNVNMNTLVTEAIQLQRDKHADSSPHISVGDLPTCFADFDQLRLAIYHLIDNAVKYAQPDQKAVVHITGSHEDGYSTYCISDKGIGIKPQYQEKVFEMFHRLEPSSPVTGEGLGLTIVRRIIDRLEGRIWVESEVDAGTQVFISLPAPTQNHSPDQL
ncbi:transporter substrate-binding domain-containing protein [Anaerohalosphaera lusitana]|nr:transporter substrate-binding domain-containing protein [Anaerohalosphaera lusitana]